LPVANYTQAEIASILAQLSRLQVSPVFVHAERMLRFLGYVVEEVLAGRGERLSQFALGVEVFDRDESFDPATDSMVRVEAGRLRAKLREYYETDGKNDAVRFELPKGTYEVRFHIDTSNNDTPLPSQAELNSARAQSGEAVVVENHQDSPGRFSLAVLPFESLSHNADDEELADAITTEIIDELGRATSFEVISRRTVLSYRGRAADARVVGQELGVSYVMEGNLRRSGKQIRVGVALIDTQNGRQMWSETYRREQADVFDLQDDIGRSVVVVLGGVVWRAAMERAQRLPADQLDVASLAHRAAEIFFNFSRHTFEEGEILARRAVEEYPESGHGYMLLAFLLTFKVVCCWTDNPEEALEEALSAADRAAEMAPKDSWILALTSQALVWIGESSRGYTLAERAFTLEPDNLVNQARLGDALVHLGRAEEGLVQIENAISLGPKEHIAPPWHYYFLCYAYGQLGRYEEAEKAGHVCVDLMGDCPLSWMIYTNALAENGKIEEAQTALAELRLLSPNMTFEYLEWVYRIAYESEDIAERHLCGLRKLNWQVA
jgi:TolB-like protein